MDSRTHIGKVRGAVVATPAAPHPTKVCDAVTVAVTREMFGRFTPEQKAQVSAVLEAADALGFAFTWTDTVLEVAS